MASNQTMTGATCTECGMESKGRDIVKQQDLGSADKYHTRCYRVAERRGVTMEAESLGRDTRDDWERDQWQVTLRFKGRTFDTPFGMGIAFEGQRPGICLVLDSLFMQDIDPDLTFDEWCDLFGFDSDSRRELAIFEESQLQTAAFREFLGDDFETVRATVQD